MMTHIEIVEEAILALNKNKNKDIKYRNPTSTNMGSVDIDIKYPNADWHNYGFVADWFNPELNYFDKVSWMEGFEVPEEWRKTKPEQVCILRIAYYFYKTGKDNNLF